MIFTKLFANKANWQHKNSAVRITAIEQELSPHEPQSKQVLVDLAANDDSDLVRRAALLKLNNIECWLTTGLNNSNQAIKSFAEQHLVSTVVSQSIDEQVHKQLITTDLPLPLVDKALTEVLSFADAKAETIIALLKRLNKPQLLQTTFNQKQLAASVKEQVQLYIVEQISEQSQLEKMLRKSASEQVTLSLTKKIDALKEAAEKPAKIAKEISLMLAKLLALKDNKDYENVVVKREQLTKQWQTFQSDFDYLTEEEVASFKQKFHDISAQLDKIFAVKKEQYQQEQIALKLENDKQQERKNFNDKLATFAQQITEAVFENTSLDDQEFATALVQLTAQINNSHLSEKEQASLVLKTNDLIAKLKKLPEIADSVSEATHLIAKIAQLSPPTKLSQLNEKSKDYQNWTQNWQQVADKAGEILPASIVEAHQEITTKWQQAFAPLVKEQRKLASIAQKKVYDLKRLLGSGKYNASFGVFKSFEKLYQQLSNQQQHKLQRDYELIKAQIAEISDWEHYIATPRKQQLLDEISQISQHPLDSPIEQANKVKAYRKQWNLLGHADDEVDQQLNDAFDQACESAFAPCRQYYAEQEKIREQHLGVRNELVANAEQLAHQCQAADLDYKKLDAQLNKLIQQWRDAGEVDRNAYRALNQSFQANIKQVKTVVGNWHDENANKKTQIINKANAQLTALTPETIENDADKDSSKLTSDQLFSAINEIKSLQSQWKNIGYAGTKFENKLWQQFRGINDQVFAKREQLQQAQQAYIDQSLTLAQQQAVDWKKALSSCQQLKDVNELSSEVEAQLVTAKRDKPVNKAVIKLYQEIMSAIEVKREKLAQRSKLNDWQNTFKLITALAQTETSDNDFTEHAAFTALSNSWQRKVKDAIRQSIKINANDCDSQLINKATLTLEILAQVPSPKEFEQERMAVQVELMKEQMTSGNNVDLTKAFFNWLAVCPLNAEFLTVAERIKRVFIKDN